MADFKPGSRVVLSNPGDYPDIGTRTGVVHAVDGWMVIEWVGLPMTVRLPQTALEVVG